MPKIQKKLIFFEKFDKYFPRRFALISVLAFKKVGLSSELNSASIDVKIIGGHRAKNILPSEGVGVSCTSWGVGERKFLPDDLG